MKRGRVSGAGQATLPGLFGTKTRRLATPREQALEVARKRLFVLMLLFSVMWVTLGGRLAYLCLRGDAQESPVARTVPGDGTATDGTAERADIVDRNGVIVATSLPTVSLCADSKAIVNPDDTARQLLTVLPDLNADRLNEDLRSGKHCAMIRRHLTPRQYYEVNKLGIAGLQFQPDERRLYPLGNLTAHVVGYTDIDNNGKGGIEQSMDQRLNDDPKPMALSIDVRVQTIMRRELADAMATFRAEAAAGLVMDIHTGEILGMVSLPDFDPSHPGSGKASDNEHVNRDTMAVYEMGSTFKIFNTALALDSGLVHMTDVFDTSHPLVFGKHRIHDFEKENRNLNVAEIFTHSSNIGSARMAEKFGGTRQRAFLARLGLTEKSTIELPATGAPIIPSARDWSEATTLTASFGHGVAVNVVQLASAVATIVNDGHTVRPTVIKSSVPVDELDDDEGPAVSPHTSALMRALMRLVVTRGTARKADVEGFMVGGKTGTADKLVDGHYVDNARVSSFIGLFPINAPRYVVFALLDDPKGNAKTQGFATGGWVAAPVVNHVIAQMGPLLGMPPLSRERADAVEQEILNPLGTETVDGVSVQEGSHYVAVDTDQGR